MHFIYRIELGGNLIICTHATSILDARDLMIEHVHEFISENEGKKKITERELKERPFECNELVDGYWFRQCDKDTIKLYFKTSKLIKGYFTETYEHSIEEVCKYSIVSYDKMSKNRGFTPVIVPKIERIQPTPDQISPQRRALIEEMKSSELFLRIKRACIVVPPED